MGTGHRQAHHGRRLRHLGKKKACRGAGSPHARIACQADEYRCPYRLSRYRSTAGRRTGSPLPFHPESYRFHIVDSCSAYFVHSPNAHYIMRVVAMQQSQKVIQYVHETIPNGSADLSHTHIDLASRPSRQRADYNGRHGRDGRPRTNAAYGSGLLYL